LDARLLAADLDDLTESQRQYAQAILDEIAAHERAKQAEDRRYEAQKRDNATAISALDEQLDLLNKIGLLTGELSQADVWADELADLGHTREEIDKIIELRQKLAGLEQQESAAASVIGARTSTIGLYRAMSEAAAKAGASGQSKVGERTATATESTKDNTERTASLAKDSKGILTDIRDVIRDVARGLPLVGAFGK
jgi:hypothetical protein